MHEYAAQLRAGLRDDPSFLSVCYDAPETADWPDRAVWKQANPALSGPEKFLSLEYLENEFRQAEAMPARQNAFRTFFLNQWVGQKDRFLDLHVWDASRGHTTTLADLDGRTGCIGLDLSAISDLTAMALVVPCRSTTDGWDVFLKCYLPDDALPGHRHEALYRQCEREGLLTLTPGNVVDYRVVERDILQLRTRVSIQGVNIDMRFQGISTATHLSDHGLDVRQMSQTHASFAAPMKALERHVKAGTLHHGGHPLLRMAIDHPTVSPKKTMA